MNARNFFIFLIVPFLLFAQNPRMDPCPDCDRPLSGFAIGGFFGAGTFAVDPDSPAVAEIMGINSIPSWSYRAGFGFYNYISGKVRLGARGGVNWNAISDNNKSISAIAYWGTLMPEFVRTTSYIRLTAGLGVGGGSAVLKIKEETVETQGNTPFFALNPSLGFEFPFGKNIISSLDITYLWFLGDDKIIGWAYRDSSRVMRFKPIEFGGPAITMSLFFGRVVEGGKQ